MTKKKVEIMSWLEFESVGCGKADIWRIMVDPQTMEVEVIVEDEKKFNERMKKKKGEKMIELNYKKRSCFNCGNHRVCRLIDRLKDITDVRYFFPKEMVASICRKFEEMK